MGSSFALAMWAVSNSQGSRTSSSVNSSPCSSFVFTSSGVISYSMKAVAAMSWLTRLPHPLRLPLLHEGMNSLLCVGGLHQLFQVKFLGARQAFVEVHR